MNYVGEFKLRVMEGEGEIFFRNGGSYYGKFVNDNIDANVLGKIKIEDDQGNVIEEECSYGYF